MVFRSNCVLHVLDAELGLVGDVPHGAADGPGAEQRALRAPQGFHALHVIKVQVRGEQRDRNRRVVQVDADLLLDTGLVADDLPGRNPADGHHGLAGPQVLNVQASHVSARALPG